ncbi:SHOCT domain-containing protein [Natrinema zhouii]|uniref:SHOCT domain-containing protein n=1 Tax=Natrinema zhouii TaxID=1710539 RepID=A0A7D6H540_9EURY|nr:SHOCT domain-containing protein [Natrinema zhouii]QLK27547.1 SHOCT domain-containing protein [Natrinema zhouii]
MGRLSSVLLQGIGVLVLALVALSVVGTIVGIALSVVVTVLSILVSLAILGLMVLAIVGLVSLFSGDEAASTETQPPQRSDDPVTTEEGLRSRYVAGELDDDEFERELERVLGPDERRGRTDFDRSSSRQPSSERHRLWER